MFLVVFLYLHFFSGDFPGQIIRFLFSSLFSNVVTGDKPRLPALPEDSHRLGCHLSTAPAAKRAVHLPGMLV